MMKQPSHPTMNKHVLMVLFACAVLLCMNSFALAQIDLISPSQNYVNNGQNITFEYYAGIQNPVSCTLIIGPQSFPDTNVNQGLNTIIVQGIAPGAYSWFVSCSNTTVNQQSSQRNITIDILPPTLQLAKPENSSEQLTIRLQGTDDTSQTLSCVAKDNDQTIDSFTVSSGTWFEKNYAMTPSQHTLNVTCFDIAGNRASVVKTYTIVVNDYFILKTNKAVYGLGEPILLTIDAQDDANITVDICPDEQGFVECISPIITQGYPQTITIPLNKSGPYVVDGVMTSPRTTKVNATNYTIENTMGLTLSTSKKPLYGIKFDLVADVFGGIGEMTYVWELDNGSVINTTSNRLSVLHTSLGLKTNTVTAIDSANNRKTTTQSYVVEEVRVLPVHVEDENNLPLAGALLQLSGSDTQYVTEENGSVNMQFELGTSTLFISKEGFKYVYEELLVTENTTQIKVKLTRDTIPINVSLITPIDGDSFTGPVSIRYLLSGPETAECTFYMGLSNDSLLQEQAVVNATRGENGFTVSDVSAGAYVYAVECFANNLAISEKRTFSIVEEQTFVPEEDLDSEIELFDNALLSIKSLDSKDQELMSLLEYDAKIKSAKKTAGQLARDIFDLRYRNDLTADEKASEAQKMRAQLDELVSQTPISLEVLDSRISVTYVSKEELENLVSSHGDLLELSSKHLESLLSAQQLYTLKTEVFRAKVKMGDGEQKSISVVAKKITYANGASGKQIIEVVPKELSKSAKDVKVVTKNHKVILDDPILSFPLTESIIYYVEKDISLGDLEDSRTVLVPQVLSESITGYSVFGVVDIPNLTLWCWLLGIILLIYLIRYFDLYGHIKYVIYKEGKQKPVHYIRVLLNDVYDLLRVNNYDKALLIYKEIKLSYDNLPTPGKNDLYDEIVAVCLELDKSFLRLLVLDMNKALKNEQFEEAIDCFARIEGTYDRLPKEEQEKVHEMVHGLAKRLGVQQ